MGSTPHTGNSQLMAACCILGRRQGCTAMKATPELASGSLKPLCTGMMEIVLGSWPSGGTQPHPKGRGQV